MTLKFIYSDNFNKKQSEAFIAQEVATLEKHKSQVCIIPRYHM